MGKRKKKELTQEQIWDDSGLIQSWNDSYEEYKRYHSIQAKGENVKDVLAAAEAADAAESDPPINDDKVIASKSQAQDTHMAGDDLEEGEVGEEEAFAPQESEGINEGQIPNTNEAQSSSQAPTPATQGVCQTAIEGSTQDASLKNLMMSWYWAGYYTGLYEGQRSQGPPAPESGPNGEAA